MDRTGINHWSIFTSVRVVHGWGEGRPDDEPNEHHYHLDADADLALIEELKLEEILMMSWVSLFQISPIQSKDRVHYVLMFHIITHKSHKCEWTNEYVLLKD